MENRIRAGAKLRIAQAEAKLGIEKAEAKLGISDKMRIHKARGMTILEVVFTLTIFMIGIGFLVKADAVSFHYRAQREIRQQMLFYAAGQIEALLEGQSVADASPPFNNFSVQTDIAEVNPQPADKVTLEQVRITVTSNAAGAPEPVNIYTYRIKP